MYRTTLSLGQYRGAAHTDTDSDLNGPSTILSSVVNNADWSVIRIMSLK